MSAKCQKRTNAVQQRKPLFNRLVGALHLDNTVLENDDPQLSCLA
jgi:hypothetical protein